MQWEHFKFEEFECKCCHKNETSDVLINWLGVLRDRVGVPFIINSGYRCKRHNASKAVKGAKDSQHLIGNAADISMVGWDDRTKYRILQGAFFIGFHGIGIGKTVIHLDIRSGEPKLWIY